MKIEQIFKNLIIANIFLFIAIILSFSFQNQKIILLSSSLEKGFFDSVVGLIFIIFVLIFYVIAIYCLYNFKKFGKNFFLYVVIAYITCILLGKIQIVNQISYALQYIATLTDGAILTLVYFSPIKEKFK